MPENQFPPPFYVVAHRGDSDHAPENTMPAFEAAIAKGADEIECDVRVTRDGVAVVIHDASPARTGGVNTLVEELTLRELQAIDVGVWRGANFAGTRVPTLEEMLAALLPRIPLQIELKAAAAVPVTVKLLQQAGREDAFERVLLTSFQRDYILEALRIEPRARVGWLVQGSELPAASSVRELGIRSYMPPCGKLTIDLVNEAHALGLSVRTWGVKDLEAARAAVATGADGATYNDPGQLLQWLKSFNLRNHALPLKPMASL